MAWIASSGSNDPYARFTRAPGPYIRTDDVLVATNWSDLIDGTLAAAIDKDEGGNPVDSSLPTFVWTNVIPDGTVNDVASNEAVDDCNGWTTDSTNSGWAWTGIATPGATDFRWTDETLSLIHFCSGLTDDGLGNIHVNRPHLYCMEQ